VAGVPLCFQNAARHLCCGGELRVYIGAGDRCVSPPKVGSGVIDSDLGRLAVSKRTIKCIEPMLTVGYVRTLRPDRRNWCELLADGHAVEF